MPSVSLLNDQFSHDLQYVLALTRYEFNLSHFFSKRDLRDIPPCGRLLARHARPLPLIRRLSLRRLQEQTVNLVLQAITRHRKIAGVELDPDARPSQAHTGSQRRA